MADNDAILDSCRSSRSFIPQQPLTSPFPTPSLRIRSSTPNLSSRVSYHKPTSEWIRSPNPSEKPEQKTIGSSESTSNIAKSPVAIPNRSITLSNTIPDADITAYRSASPVSMDLRPKTSPVLRSMASSPSLRVSPSSFTTSIATPVSSSCADIGICVNQDNSDSRQNDSPPVREHKLSNPYPPKLNNRTFITPGVDLTFQELVEAQNVILYNQGAQPVRFGDLFRDQKTIVIFIRHFLCPFCADYMRAIVREVKPRTLARSDVKLFVVSHGSPYMIKSYRSIFNLPYPVYTDPSRKIYRALNMTLRTLSGGPKSERGGYLEHNLTLGLARVAQNAIKARMPLYRYPGDFFQVGGEFILGPGLKCSYASRMYNTASHAPIKEILKAAGVDLSVPIALDSGTDWARVREEELERIRQKKGHRRGHPTPLADNANQSDQTSISERLESVDITHIRELLRASRQLSL